MLHLLLISKIMSLAIVDEVRQFVAFGAIFCPKFIALREYLFSKLMESEESDYLEQVIKVTVLFMTSTFNNELTMKL